MATENVEMVPVKSSNIAAVGYNEAEKVLIVQFNKGAVYHYRGVSKAVFEDLLMAESAGSYFAANVKDSYPCKRA